MEKTIVSALTFFRVLGETLPEFSAELKKLSDAEKRELAELVCKQFGWTLKA